MKGTYVDVEVMVDRLDGRAVVPCEHGLGEVLDVPDVGHRVRVVGPSCDAEVSKSEFTYSVARTQTYRAGGEDLESDDDDGGSE
jgi:hypothetical protein